jgi:hypothetical protein
MVRKFTDTINSNWGFLGAEGGITFPLLTVFTFGLSILRKVYCNARISQFQSISNAGCYIDLGHLCDGNSLTAPHSFPSGYHISNESWVLLCLFILLNQFFFVTLWPLKPHTCSISSQNYGQRPCIYRGIMKLKIFVK